MAYNDVVLLDSLIEKFREQWGSTLDNSELFELFCFDQILKNYDLSFEEIELGHVDSGDDGGIDGFYVFVDDTILTEDTDLKSVRRNPEIEVIIVTAKFSTQFKQVPINNLISSLIELFDLRKSVDEICYPFEVSIIKIRELFRKTYIALADRNPQLRFNIYYTCRGETINLNPNIKSRAIALEDNIKSFFSSADARFLFLGATELLQRARKMKSYSLRLKITENYISRAQTNYIVLTTLSDYFSFIIKWLTKFGHKKGQK